MAAAKREQALARARKRVCSSEVRGGRERHQQVRHAVDHAEEGEEREAEIPADDDRRQPAPRRKHRGAVCARGVH
eukprot:5233517-Pleurochrysis_carterae.AAC.1